MASFNVIQFYQTGQRKPSFKNGSLYIKNFRDFTLFRYIWVYEKFEDHYDKTMHYFYSILLGLISAFICAHFAKKRGRNPLHWFIWGVLFGLFAVCTLFLLPVRKAVSAAPAPPAPPIPLLQALAPTQACKLWYYLDPEKQQRGPMSFDGLNREWSEGKLHVQSFVWNDELDNWKRLEEVVTIFQKK